MRIYFFLCGLIGAPNRNACVCRAGYATRYIPFNFCRCLCVCIAQIDSTRNSFLCCVRHELRRSASVRISRPWNFIFPVISFSLIRLTFAGCAKHYNDQHKFDILVSWLTTLIVFVRNSCTLCCGARRGLLPWMKGEWLMAVGVSFVDFGCSTLGECTCACNAWLVSVCMCGCALQLT